MSYSILYKSMFVKLSNGSYIPMIEMGDNNCYEVSYGRGKSRRTRSWSNMNLNNGQKFFTQDEIKNSLNEWNDEVEMRKSDGDDNCSFGFMDGIAVYGKHTSDTTFNDVKNLIMRGIKYAISFEEAKGLGLSISYRDNDWFTSKAFDSEDEMMQFINDTFGNDNKKYWFSFKPYNVEQFYNIKRAIESFGKLNGKTKKFKLCVTLDDGSHKYVSIDDMNRMKLVDDIEHGMVFNKYKTHNIDINDLIYHQFKEVRSVRFLYV